MPWDVRLNTGLWPLTCPGLADGVTLWSLDGPRDRTKDTFLSFSGGSHKQVLPAPPHRALGSGPGVQRAAATLSVAVVSAEVEMTACALLTSPS